MIPHKLAGRITPRDTPLASPSFFMAHFTASFNSASTPSVESNLIVAQTSNATRPKYESNRAGFI